MAPKRTRDQLPTVAYTIDDRGVPMVLVRGMGTPQSDSSLATDASGRSTLTVTFHIHAKDQYVSWEELGEMAEAERIAKETELAGN